jgi:hypoxia up-regulated 1
MPLHSVVSGCIYHESCFVLGKEVNQDGKFQKALDVAGLEVKDLDSCHSPRWCYSDSPVQKELEKFVSKVENIRTKVNSYEAAVTGANFGGVGLSLSFRGKEIRASEATVYPSDIK